MILDGFRSHYKKHISTIRTNSRLSCFVLHDADDVALIGHVIDRLATIVCFLGISNDSRRSNDSKRSSITKWTQLDLFFLSVKWAFVNKVHKDVLIFDKVQVDIYIFMSMDPMINCVSISLQNLNEISTLPSSIMRLVMENVNIHVYLWGT